MKTMASILAGALCAVSFVSSAWAQQGLATSGGGVSGRNTIQQAPSGGRVGTGGGTGTAAAGSGGATAGAPTPEERQTEKHNNDVTQICKGC